MTQLGIISDDLSRLVENVRLISVVIFSRPPCFFNEVNCKLVLILNEIRNDQGFYSTTFVFTLDVATKYRKQKNYRLLDW